MYNKAQRIYEFDGFRLDVNERQLWRDGEPVALYAKAFEMLVVMVENSGRLLTKNDLFSHVWSDQIVEESNLTVNMSAIRKALGERGRISLTGRFDLAAMRNTLQTIYQSIS